MSFTWFQSYQKGVPQTIDPRQYSSIVELLEEAFAEYESGDAFYCMGKTLTYGELDLLSKKFASFLQNELGLSPGDRVALMMPNILQYPIALFAALRAGLVVVNVNPLYTERELAFQLKDSGAKAIVIFENSCHILQKVLANYPDPLHILVTGIGDLLDFPKNLLVNFVIKRVKKMIPAWQIDGTRDFKQSLFAADATKYNPPTINREGLAFLQYTGGTTGVAKGAMLTHGNIVANVLQARAWIKDCLRPGQESIITALPLYHIFSLTANCLIFCSIGARNILITNPRDIAGFIKELKKWKFTAITGVNTLFNALLNHPDFAQLDFSELHLTLGGGMAVQKSVAERWQKVTGCPLIEAYGLTETSPAACINPMDLKAYNGKIGLPIPSTEVVILNDDGKTLAAGEIGEISIKGPQVMSGYWQNPAETKAVMQGGIF